MALSWSFPSYSFYQFLWIYRICILNSLGQLFLVDLQYVTPPQAAKGFVKEYSLNAVPDLIRSTLHFSYL